MSKLLTEVSTWRAGGRASASDFNAVADAVKVNRGSMIDAGIVDSTGVHTRGRPHTNVQVWVGVVSAYSQVGSNKQWTYTVTRQVKESAGYGGWGDDSDGFSYTCYNMAEDGNGSSGLMGNGVDTANLTGTYDVQPIPAGRAVVVFETSLVDGTTEYWIVGDPNGIDGACP